MRVTLETTRLRLRRMCAADCARVVALVGDFDVARMLARVPHPYAPHDFHGWLAHIDAAWERGADFPLAIELDGEGLIGCIGAHRRDEGDFEFGYWIGKPYWGRGYATEAGRAMLIWLREARGIDCLKSQHFAENAKSGAVLEKLGFRYTGETVMQSSLARGADAPSRQMTWRAPARALETHSALERAS